jgi:hypothetical protein
MVGPVPATQRTSAAKAYMDVLDRAIARDTGEDVDEEVPWARMTPAQRAAHRALLLRAAAIAEADAAAAAAEHSDN